MITKERKEKIKEDVENSISYQIDIGETLGNLDLTDDEFNWGLEHITWSIEIDEKGATNENREG